MFSKDFTYETGKVKFTVCILFLTNRGLLCRKILKKKIKTTGDYQNKSQTWLHNEHLEEISSFFMVWQILEPWWITKRHWQRHVPLFCAGPFDLSWVFFSFSGSSLLPFWGITSIKITGLGDQLLLRVLSLLLLASFFCGLNTPACSNKCLNHRWSAPRLSVTRSRRTCDWRSPFVLSSPFTFYTSTISLLLISLVEFRW